MLEEIRKLVADCNDTVNKKVDELVENSAYKKDGEDGGTGIAARSGMCCITAIVGLLELARLDSGDNSGKLVLPSICAGSMDIWRSRQKSVRASDSESGFAEHRCFGYRWYNDIKSKIAIASGQLPEMHAWNSVYVPHLDARFYVDFTLSHQRKQFLAVADEVKNGDNIFDYEHEPFHFEPAREYDFIRYPVNYIVDRDAFNFFASTAMRREQHYQMFGREQMDKLFAAQRSRL